MKKIGYRKELGDVSKENMRTELADIRSKLREIAHGPFVRKTIIGDEGVYLIPGIFTQNAVIVTGTTNERDYSRIDLQIESTGVIPRVNRTLRSILERDGYHIEY